jgi:hypothetical protein
VRLPKLYKEACPNCGDLSKFFNEVTNTKCKNCQYKSVKEGGSIALKKERDKVDRDVVLFIEDLDKY